MDEPNVTHAVRPGVASGYRVTEKSVFGFPLKPAHASLDHARRDIVRCFTL